MHASDPAQFEVWQCTYARGARLRSQYFYDFGAHGEEDGLVSMDYSLWALVGTRATVVVDTGCRHDVADRRGLEWLAEPADLLRDIGIRREEVPLVVVTHLHYDHAGNLALFPSARALVHEEEVRFWTADENRTPRFTAAVEPDDLGALKSLSRQGRVELLAGDGVRSVVPGIEVKRVGGHAPGQMVVRVATRSGPVVLASDAVHLYDQMDNGWPFAVFVDLQATYRAFEEVRALAGGRAHAIVPGHDPRVRQERVTGTAVAGDASDLVVRIA